MVIFLGMNPVRVPVQGSGWTRPTLLKTFYHALPCPFFPLFLTFPLKTTIEVYRFLAKMVSE